MADGTLDEETRLAELELWRSEDPLLWLIHRGLGSATIEKARLGYNPTKHAINIPYLNPDGSVRQNRLRLLNPGHVKYLTPSGGGTHLYQVANTRLPVLWMTEGEFDTLILQQMGHPSVGCAGSQSFKPEWKYLFAYCRRLTVVADGDEAGYKAARRVASMVGPLVDEIRVVDMPQGLDVTDLYLRDRQELAALVG